MNKHKQLFVTAFRQAYPNDEFAKRNQWTTPREREKLKTKHRTLSAREEKCVWLETSMIRAHKL